MSIKTRVDFSMAAGKDKSHNESILHFSKERLLPSAVIYGANAAGKSNFIKAFAAAIIIMRTSNNRQINEKIPLLIPFQFDNTSSKEPTSFDFIFIANGKKYEYGFSADENKIYDEYLNEYNSAKPSSVFERSNTNDYSFTKADEKEFNDYRNKTADNKLFLSTATAWNCKRTKDAYLWFAEGIDTYDSMNLEQVAFNLLSEDKDNSLKPFMVDMLNKADVNISDYEFQTKDLSNEDISNLPIPFGVQISDQVKTAVKGYKINTHHSVNNKTGKTDYSLPFSLESEGTKKLFFFSPIVKQALENGKTIVIDELDASLHPLLVKGIVDLFNNPAINTNQAQLVFNTQDVSTMSLDLFRRDQIYFINKDCNTGISDLYSLDEFSPRKKENVRKGYMQGKFGAIPFVDFGGLK